MNACNSATRPSTNINAVVDCPCSSINDCMQCRTANCNWCQNSCTDAVCAGGNPQCPTSPTPGSTALEMVTLPTRTTTIAATIPSGATFAPPTPVPIPVPTPSVVLSTTSSSDCAQYKDCSACVKSEPNCGWCDKERYCSAACAKSALSSGAAATTCPFDNGSSSSSVTIEYVCLLFLDFAVKNNFRRRLMSR